MFLSLNGIEVQVAARGPSCDLQPVGADWRSPLTGRLRRGVRVLKREWRFATPPLPVAGGVSRAFAGLIDGAGESWDFDSFYSNGGMPCTSLLGATHASGQMGLGPGGSIQFDLPTGTVALYRYDGAAWTRYVVRGDGAKWVNGVREDAADTSWMTVTSSRVVIANPLATIVWYMRLRILPYLAPVDWVPGLSAVEFVLPRLKATGDFDPSGAAGVVVECQVDTVDVVQLAEGMHETISFTMREV